MKKKALLSIVLLCTFLTSFSQLSGTYTIGTTGNYTSFTSAITALTTSGINGPIVFNVSPGTYNEQIIIPAITGASATNTITFQSSNGDSTSVTISYAPTSTANNYILKLNGAKHIIIKQITLRSFGVSHGKVVDITNGSGNLKFIGNQLIGKFLTSSTQYMEVFLLKSIPGQAEMHDIEITGNLIKNGFFGLDILSTITNSFITNLIITNNIFLDQYGRSVYLYEISGTKIKNNIFSRYIFNSNSTYQGISCGACNVGLEIEKNKFFLCGGIGAAIYIAACNGNTNDYGLVSNNFIFINSHFLYEAVNYSQSSYQKFINNSVNIIDTIGSNTSSIAFKLAGTNVVSKNNILNNSAGGLAFYSGVAATNFTSDYNNLISNGYYLAELYGSGPIANLSGWQSVSTKDSNSVSINPMFISNTDLHVTNSLMDNLGIPDIDIIDDIDGQLRDSLTPDIGADEFSLYNIDLAAISLIPPISGGCYSTNDTIKVAIKNLGQSTIQFSVDTAYVNVSVSGVNPDTFSVVVLSSDSLQADSIMEVIVSINYNMSFQGVYSFHINISSNVDNNLANNNLTQSITNHIVTSLPLIEDFESFYTGDFLYNNGGFENGWQRGNETTYKTWVASGASPNVNWGSGPSVDHTLGLPPGKYICFYGYGSGAITSFTSPCIDLSSGQNLKLKFWYHMYGSGINSLYLDIYYNGLWNNNIYSISGQQQTSSSAPWQSSIVNLANYTGIIKVRFRATNTNSMADIGLDDIIISNSPITNLGNDTTICFGDTLQLNAGSGSNYTYTWKKLPLTTTISTSQYLNVSDTGTYIVEVENEYSFMSFDTIVISYHPILNSFTGNDTSICEGNSLVLSSAVSLNYDTLFWTSSGSGYFQNNNVLNTIYYPDSIDIVNGFVNLILNASSFCESISDTLLLTINSLPAVYAGIDQSIQCGGLGVTLGSTNNPNYSYLWFPSAGLSNSNVSNPVATPNINTVYTLSVTDNTTGCSATDDVIVSILGGPTAIASNDTTICKGDNITLSVTSGNSYLWNTGDTTSTILVNPISSTIYTVTVTSSQCSDADTVFVYVNNPVVYLGIDTSICYNESIVLDAGQGFSSYLWSTGETTQTIVIDSTGIGIGTKLFYVIVEDSLGCEARDSIIIKINPCDIFVAENFNEPRIIVFPNPTTGKLNIRIENNDIEEYKLCLYNSMGKLVYCKELRMTKNITEHLIDLTLYPKGIYFVRFENRNFVNVEKVVVQ
ncbi:MAG: T9SS type A sorting domain-containing protein [Saprospiraceae bacterium]|nr:T9SS type A sorting domain-containing protein [Saprospiraceae bacterium]